MTISEIGELISKVRNDYQKLYENHLLSIQSNGTAGLKCFNPEVLEHLVNWTDKEILDDFAKNGTVIDGADEYLASLNK